VPQNLTAQRPKAVFSVLEFGQQVGGDRIGMCLGGWHAVTPRVTRGSLEERDILMHGEPLNSKQKKPQLRGQEQTTNAIKAREE